MTNRDDRSVSLYLNELTGIGMLDADTELDLAIRSRKGDQEAARRLVSGNLRFVVSIAKQFQNQGFPLADLIAEGNLGLIEAAKRFEPLTFNSEKGKTYFLQ
ncbi:sigma factor [Mucilaginibacter conchicola]|nr:sigma factor [Mucilaginibacter conchicola]